MKQVIQNGAKNNIKNHLKIDRKFDTKKGAPHGVWNCTYINRINTKRRCPTCKKSKEGTNNLQKYQTDDQRKVIYEGKLRKGDLQKVIYEGKLRKGDVQKVIHEGKLQKR